MLLSIISGTFNRIDYLKRMIASVRDQMPRHLSYEFVIIDGGSTDGSIEYLESQSDVKLIAHGELRGAIISFSEGARTATGQYKVMANDDIEFHPYSLLRAIAYLEEHRTCGGVAFADNRFARVAGDDLYRVMQMPAIALDGKMSSVNYAQVGCFRGWLADMVGHWGDTDPIMGKARTYGGDNYESARIWELGYSVDSVAGCAIDDFIPPDAMRARNVSAGVRDSNQYYARFPRGPRLQPYPQVHNPDRERLRVIVMDAHARELPARTAKEKGLADAFADIGLVYHIDYLNDPYDLPQIVRAWQPHLLLTQMHQPNEHLNQQVFQAAREQKPDLLIVNWNGDAHERGLTDSETIEVLREIDLQTVVNAKVLPIYKRKGIPARYWQIGFKESASPYQGSVSAHDVLWQGNAYDQRRKDMISALRAIRINKRKLNLGLYGSVEGANGNTHYDFSQQEALNRAATIVIGDTYPDTVAFVSNRLFQVLGAGGFLLQENSGNLDKYTGLKAGVHYVQWTDLADLKAKIIEWLRPEMADQRRTIAGAGREFVRANFSYSAQVEKLIDALL